MFFYDIRFQPANLKILEPIYFKFEGERAAKKRNFFGQNFPKKTPKTAFRRSENHFLVDLNHFENNLKIRLPPRENFRTAAGLLTSLRIESSKKKKKSTFALPRGGSRTFSRGGGGGGFSKIFPKF